LVFKERVSSVTVECVVLLCSTYLAPEARGTKGGLKILVQQKNMTLEELNNHCNELSAELKKMTLEKDELADQHRELVSAKTTIETQMNEKLDAAAEAAQKLHLESKLRFTR